MQQTVLHKMSNISSKLKDADSVQRMKRMCGNDDIHRGQLILMQAQQHYAAMFRFRIERDRNKRYAFGDQWGDTVNVDGIQMTEAEYIKRQGNIPLKTNLIRRLTRSVVGVYRNQASEPMCIARDRDEQQIAEVMSTMLQYNMQLNRMKEMYARSLEEYLIGGMVVHRKWYGWKNGKMDCWTENVQPNNFFIDNNMRDFRSWDCSIVGEIHDILFEQLCEQFADSPSSYKKLEEIYRFARDNEYFLSTWEAFGMNRDRIDMDFFTPKDSSRCRVIEVWRKESKPRWRCHDYTNGDIFKCDECDYPKLVVEENERRLAQGHSVGMSADEIPLIKASWFMDSFWYYYYLSPMGDILAEGETPYEHGEHPYVFKAYPFIDGEIHSFVNDVIDQQRYINRLITLNDWVIRSSAKGVLMVPEDCLNGMDPREFADEWTKFNGVIVYKPSKSGHTPQQVSSNSTNIGINDMLMTQLSFFEDISGVHGALQGKQGYSGMSGTLFNQQAQNSTLSLLDIIESFQQFELDAAYKDVKNIQQFCDSKRVLNITGKSGNLVVYNPEKIRDAEFDLSIVTGTSTPAYRTISNEFLMQLFQKGAISVEQLLQNGSFPFSDKLLQSIQSQKEQIEQGQVPGGISPELMEQVKAGANPNVVSALSRK